MNCVNERERTGGVSHANYFAHRVDRADSVGRVTDGDKARAIELLDELLSRPSEVTSESLKLDPAWDPLRSDPAFEALFAKYAGKA